MSGALAMLMGAPTLARVSFNNSDFSNSASTATVTSPTRTVVTGGDATITAVGDGTPEYQVNGGSWTAIGDGANVSLAASDTLAVRATGLASLDACIINITSDGDLVGSGTLERT